MRWPCGVIFTDGGASWSELRTGTRAGLKGFFRGVLAFASARAGPSFKRRTVGLRGSVSKLARHRQAGAPSFVAGGSGVEPTKIAHTVRVRALPIRAVQPSAVSSTPSRMLPSRGRKSTPPGPIFELYLTESAKNTSSAMTRFRKSDFIPRQLPFPRT